MLSKLAASKLITGAIDDEKEAEIGKPNESNEHRLPTIPRRVVDDLHHGYISDITSKQVVITETYSNQAGRKFTFECENGEYKSQVMKINDEVIFTYVEEEDGSSVVKSLEMVEDRCKKMDGCCLLSSAPPTPDTKQPAAFNTHTIQFKTTSNAADSFQIGIPVESNKKNLATNSSKSFSDIQIGYITKVTFTEVVIDNKYTYELKQFTLGKYKVRDKVAFIYEEKEDGSCVVISLIVVENFDSKKDSSARTSSISHLQIEMPNESNKKNLATTYSKPLRDLHLGIITNIFDREVEINHKYTYELKEFPYGRYELYAKVTFTYDEKKDGSCIVRSLNIFEDRDLKNECSGQASSASHVKELRGTVIYKFHHIFIVKLSKCEVFCNLPDVLDDHPDVPTVGDIVELTAILKSEGCDEIAENVLKIQSIDYYHYLHSFKGIITQFDGLRGRIDTESAMSFDYVIYFSTKVCSKHYRPRFGDVVSGEASCRNYGEPSIYEARIVEPLWYKTLQRDDLLKWKNGIELRVIRDQITGSVYEPYQFTIEVTNTSEERGCTLNEIVYRYNDDLVTECDFSSAVEIPASQSYHANFLSFPNNGGLHTFTVVFIFDGGIEIGQPVTIAVVLRRPTSYYSRNRSYVYDPLPRNCFNEDFMRMMTGGEVVPCEETRRFVPRYARSFMNKFVIPEQLVEIFSTQFGSAADLDMQLLRTVPVLNEEFCIENYVEKFINLIYLESIEARKSLTSLDIPCIYFGKDGKYLTLLLEQGQSRKISEGDKLLAVRESLETLFYEGIINKVEDDTVWIEFDETFANEYAGENYAINFIFDDSHYRKQCHAVKKAYYALGKDILFPNTLAIAKSFDQLCVSDVEKNEMSFDSMGYHPHDGNKCTKNIVPDSVDNGKEWNGLHIQWVNKLLNAEQKFAVRNILRGYARPYPYVIFGPPGTGKTNTIVEAISQIIRNLPWSRILVATPSNSAANLLCERLVMKDPTITARELLRVLSYRYAVTGGVPPNLVPYCTYVELGSIRNEGYVADPLHGVPPTTASLLLERRIIVGTCISSLVFHRLDWITFTHIFVDEAGQCAEPEVMATLSLFNKDLGQIVLSGDPKQLGPVVISPWARKYGLDLSYMERLLSMSPYCQDVARFPDTLGYDPTIITKLIRNYRSQPDLLNLYNSLYYNHHLKAMMCPYKHQIKLDFALLFGTPPPTSHPSVMFHGVIGTNIKEEITKSWYNMEELFVVNMYVGRLLDQNASIDDIGVVSPYCSQVMHLKEIMEPNIPRLPKIGTVEEFQGQEKEIIIFTTVRSEMHLENPPNFVCDQKRMNVAISRAKSFLIIVGNPNVLAFNDDWKYIIKFCVDSSCYVGGQLRVPLNPEPTVAGSGGIARPCNSRRPLKCKHSSVGAF